MPAYEYIRIKLDMGDLSELNRFSNDGWRVAAIAYDIVEGCIRDYALLERPLPESKCS